MERTDEALYESFIKGNDEEAIRLLFDKYREPLTAYVNGIVRNVDDAEEIMMDCFAIVIAATTRFTGRQKSTFKTWLYAIATKRAYLFLRKHPMTQSLEEGAKGSEPESGLLREEKNRALYEAMSKLSCDQKTVLYLKFFEDMKPEEISRIMKKSVKQVYKLTENGKMRLRELLGESKTGGDSIWDM